ncbi:glucose-fructose oxidoreductase [Catalinimonas alkaloidigena]|uniref:Gfo/Idh/MocA family protein n=1 Tax=Catalinimonas alkaloidigena TaxID=1075417 RepID=UPI0024049989|nr:Gfo/Idh/MocA family oxidoreductase [Catalinimonas alkaloidigena]MDF9796152.1 glucose-fructose oxidoreductase [Catalinimonas alkaloidigena]
MKNHKISRRNFNKTLTAGIGGLGLTPQTTFASSFRKVNQDRKLGVALVGLGNYSTGQLAPALQETKNCYLSGVVTGTPAKEKVWAEKYNLPEKNIYNYENFDNIADNEDIDIIYVVLPNAMHAEYTVRAAQAGKHVICEKPMAITSEECQQMINACERANVKLSIGYRLHFEPHNQEIMRLGQNNVMGNIMFIDCGAGYLMGDNWDQWRLKKELAGTGALGNMGVYAIQGVIYTVGENPLYVRAQEFKTKPEKFKEVDETVTFQFEFPGGTVANLQTSHNARTNRLYASCESGWFELDPFSPYGGIKGSSSNGPIVYPQVNQQALQMDDFADCILNDRKTPVPGEMGKRDVQIIEAILESIDTGEKVMLSDLAF